MLPKKPLIDWKRRFMELTDKLAEQWLEVAKIGCGKTMDELRTIFKDSITNDYDGFIDLNYKDLCVTFSTTENGLAFIDPYFEWYNENGVFMSRVKITCEEYGN